jgi:hypothetical protein
VTPGVWTSANELADLPMSGPAWRNLKKTADRPSGIPNLADQNDNTDTQVMAKALVYVQTGQPIYRNQVIIGCMNAIGTEVGGNALALSRNLIGYVIAADLVVLPAAEDAVFKDWLAAVRDADLQGRTLRGTHAERPNNWGTHAGASRAAVAVYLQDAVDLQMTAAIFKGWLGDRETYQGFDFGELWWQANPDEPVAINPVGSEIDGHPVDGVLPDDQRRGGPFTWPPFQENYVYEALQGALAQAIVLSRQGYDVWNWEDQALLRAFRWLHDAANYPAEGDDRWQPHAVNWYYGECFPAPVPAEHGKNVGWTDWTYWSCPADFNGDGAVDVTDLLVILGQWGLSADCVTDLNGDGEISINDFLVLLGTWGNCTDP